MRRLSIKLVLLALMTGTNAEAGPIYTTTDLGAGYTLETDGGGHVNGVANSDGSVVYAFDKSPVTAINIPTGTSGGHAYRYGLLTMQNGDHQVGYIYDYGGGYSGNHPSFGYYGNGWATSVGQSPVLDINKNGQVVGTSLNLVQGSKGPYDYAAFSDANGHSHGFGSQTVDNLNNYIATIPGVNLSSAFKIDDLGRILAVGSDGHDYLLTPTALGPAATVPEPSSWMMFGLGGIVIAFPSILRSWLP